MNKYPDEIVREARMRKMKPEDYLRELEECAEADARLAVIDLKETERDAAAG